MSKKGNGRPRKFAVLKQLSKSPSNQFGITAIKTAGYFPWNAKLSVTVEKSTHTPPENDKSERCNFVFSNGKNKSKIDAVSFGDVGKENYDLLKKGNTYVIQGNIEAQKRNMKLTASSLSTSKFSLILRKISIEQELTHQGNATSVNTSLKEVKQKLQKGRKFNQEFHNLTIKSGQLYRYLGCETCTAKIQFRDGMGKFVCPNCPKKDRTVNRKMCMMLKHIVLSDDSGNELENVLCFNKDCVKLIGKQAAEFEHDLQAKVLFEDLIGAKISGILRLVMEKTSSATACVNSWKIIATSITMEPKNDKKGDDDEIDDVFYTDSLILIQKTWKMIS